MLASVAIFAGTVPVPTSAGATPALGPGATKFDTSNLSAQIPFLDSTVRTVQGAKVNGSCRFTLSSRRTAGEAPVRVVELARDSASCVDQFRIGHVSRAQLPAPAAASPLYCLYGGVAHMRWWDPANINLTDSSVVNSASCFDDSGTAQSTYCSGYAPTPYTFPDGWYEDAGTYFYANPGGSNCNFQAYEEFYNGPFCGGTWIHVWPMTYYNWNDGSSSLTFSTWSSGNCWNWLHYDYWYT
jgi:hypothetical protein